MARLTADQAAEKWASRLSGATTEITNGVNAVTKAPGASAAAAVEVWAARTLAAKQKWARNVGRVSLSEWQDKMRTVGIPRIAQGAMANKPKVTAFMNEFLPFVDQVTARVRAMPNATIEDGIARAIEQIRGNAKFQRGGGNAQTGR